MRSGARAIVKPLSWLGLASVVAGAAVLAPFVNADARAGARTTRTICGAPGARLLASSGPLKEIEATRTDPSTGPYRDVEACIGSQRPYQLYLLTGSDGNCYPRTARATSHRYAGIDVRCDLSSIGFVGDSIFSFDVKRGRYLRGSPEALVEGDRPGFVLAANGAIAVIEDTGQYTEVTGCDAHADCESGPVIKARMLDKVRDPRTVGALGVRGDIVSWRHGSKRRSARLY